MGINIDLVAEPRRGIFGRKKFDLDKIAARLIESHPLPDPLHRMAQTFEARDDEVWVSLSPFEEDVNLSLLDDGRLLVSAKTSSLGPGYHAHLVEALNSVADDQGFEWTQTEDHFDETGFFSDGDFDRLQDAFSDFFKVLADLVLKDLEDGNTGIRLALPLNFQPYGPGKALATQRGWRGAEFLVAGTRAHPFQYYPWWEAELTGPTALAMAEVHLWTLFPWRAPLDDFERNVGEVARDLLMNVQPLPGDWPAALQELGTVLDGEDFCPPSPQGIGYLRSDMMRELTGGWTVQVPGWFFEAIDDDGGGVTFWSEDRAVRGVSGSGEAEVPFDPETALQDMEGDLRHLFEHAAYAGSFEDAPDDHWPNGRQFQGTIQFGETVDGVHTGHLCIVTLTYESADLDDWAKQVFLSVTPPGYGP